MQRLSPSSETPLAHWGQGWSAERRPARRRSTGRSQCPQTCSTGGGRPAPPCTGRRPCGAALLAHPRSGRPGPVGGPRTPRARSPRGQRTCGLRALQSWRRLPGPRLGRRRFDVTRQDVASRGNFGEVITRSAARRGAPTRSGAAGWTTRPGRGSPATARPVPSRTRRPRTSGLRGRSGRRRPPARPLRPR